MGSETQKKEFYLGHYLLQGNSISPDLNHGNNRRNQKAVRKALYESMPTGARMQVVERQYVSELSDLVESPEFSRERLMELRPLETDEDVDNYEFSRPLEDKDLDPMLKKRLIKHGYYNEGVKVMDFVVLYNPKGRDLRLGPMNKAADEFTGSTTVVPFSTYQEKFQQALTRLEPEKKKTESRRTFSSGRDSVMPLAAVAAPYKG